MSKSLLSLRKFPTLHTTNFVCQHTHCEGGSIPPAVDRRLATMLARLLADYPPNSDLFRWLHELVDMWDGENNDYTFWFEGTGMPRRDYNVRVSQRGQKKVEEIVQSAIRSYKIGRPVQLGVVEESLQDAFEVIKTRPHFSKLHLYETTPFMEFFADLLQTVEIYGLELTSAGKEALAHLSRAREDEAYLTGNLCKVGELLEELDQLVDGMLLGDADAAEDIQVSSTSSEWWGFFPAVMPLCVTLHLDVYVQPAHSKEERAKRKQLISDKELDCQQDDPSKNTAVEAEECPSPR